MGGKNETTIAGLRFHENNGFVHIHDDTKKLKFEMKSTLFSEEIKGITKELKNKEGIACITGSGYSTLCLCRKGKDLFAFLISGLVGKGGTDIEKDLKNFVEAL